MNKRMQKDCLQMNLHYTNTQTKPQVDKNRALVPAARKSMQRVLCKTMTFFKQKRLIIG